MSILVLCIPTIQLLCRPCVPRIHGTIKGELTQDKLDFIISERNRINNALSSFEDMQQAYLRDEIDFDTYSSFLSEYNYAYSRNELFTVIEEHSEYLDNIEKIGETAWFLYDTGWKKLLFSGFDWTLYAVLIILISGTFVVEFDKKSSSGSFSQYSQVNQTRAK